MHQISTELKKMEEKDKRVTNRWNEILRSEEHNKAKVNISKYDWIYSIDTSNPVVHSIKGIKYEENLGLMKKDSQKLFEMINYPADQIDKDLLVHNLYQFRRIVNGTANGWNV